MRLLHLSLCVGLCVSGCYDMHERPLDRALVDAGTRPRDVSVWPDTPWIDEHDAFFPPPPLDAGAVCAEAPLPGFPHLLDCPESVPAGEPVAVTLGHHSGACCPDSGALPTEVRPGRDTPDFGLITGWSRCECCEACACVGGAATETITLGSFSAGEVVGVTAGDLHCSIRITDAPLCRNAPPTRWLVPAAVRPGDPIPVGMISDVSGCSCSPRISGPPSGGSTVALSLCECCDDCMCDDPPYDGTVVITPVTPGPWTWTAPSGEVSPLIRTVVVPLESCIPATLTRATLVGPDAGRRSATPNAVWLHVEMASFGCCLTPLPYVEIDMRRGGPPQFGLRAYDCGADPCDCDGAREFRSETDVFLGTWPAGNYAVDLGPGVPVLPFTLR